jgi:NAD(P)-dependent dehydrogenase (short-subunit alcohol dehydrogenase family)
MNDAVALVTGGAGNVGRAVTHAFLRQGARVAVPFYRTDQPQALEPLVEEYGERLHRFALDLTTERGAEQAVKQVVEWAGRLDVVAHLVGGYSGGAKLADTAMDAWDRMMDLNLKSAYLVAHFAIPKMLEHGGGSFVFVSSRAAVRDRAGHGGYAVAKSALITLAGVIAEEYGQDGIRANAVLPGTIDTEANRQSMPRAKHDNWTSPEQIAEVIAFLASSASAAVNGAAIPVYGKS